MADLEFILENIIKVSGTKGIKDLEKAAREAEITISELDNAIRRYNVTEIRATRIAVNNARRISQTNRLNDYLHGSNRRGGVYNGATFTSKPFSRTASFAMQEKADIRGIQDSLLRSKTKFKVIRDASVNRWKLERWQERQEDKFLKDQDRERVKGYKRRAQAIKTQMKIQKEEYDSESKFLKEKAKAKDKYNRKSAADSARVFVEAAEDSRQKAAAFVEIRDAANKQKAEIDAHTSKNISEAQARANRLAGLNDDGTKSAKQSAEVFNQMFQQEAARNKTRSFINNYSPSMSSSNSSTPAEIKARNDIKAGLGGGIESHEDMMKRVRAEIKENGKQTANWGKAMKQVKSPLDSVLKLRHLMFGLGAYGMFEGLKNSIESVADALGDAYKESILFNEEIQRSNTIFQGLGVLGTGMSATDIRGLADGDPRKAQLKASQKFSREMTEMLLGESAYTGQDFGKIVGAASTVLPDMFDKLKKSGVNVNPVLNDGEMMKKLVKDYIRLGSVLQMTDPMGHDLKWQLVAIQEMFAGTSGGSKDRGKEIVASARRRLGIRIDEVDAKKISSAVNAGKLPEAMKLIIERFERAGISANKLADFMSENLLPNINAVTAGFKFFGAAISKISYNGLIDFFNGLRNYMNAVKEHPIFKGLVEKWSERIGVVTQKVGDKIAGWVDKFMGDDFKGIDKFITISIEAIQNGIELVGAFAEGFAQGFFGQDYTGFMSFTEALKNSIPSAYALGDALGKIANALATVSMWLSNLTAWSVQNPALAGAIFGAAGGAMLGIPSGPVGMLAGAGVGGTMGLLGGATLGTAMMPNYGGRKLDELQQYQQMQSLQYFPYSNYNKGGVTINVAGDVKVDGNAKDAKSVTLPGGMNLAEFARVKGW